MPREARHDLALLVVPHQWFEEEELRLRTVLGTENDILAGVEQGEDRQRVVPGPVGPRSSTRCYGGRGSPSPARSGFGRLAPGVSPPSSMSSSRVSTALEPEPW